MNNPYGMVVGEDTDRVDDPTLRPAFCHDTACPGHTRGFLFFAETELCPWCGKEDWS